MSAPDSIGRPSRMREAMHGTVIDDEKPCEGRRDQPSHQGRLDCFFSETKPPPRERVRFRRSLLLASVVTTFLAGMEFLLVNDRHDEVLREGPSFHRLKLQEESFSKTSRTNSSWWSPRVNRWSHATNTMDKLTSALAKSAVEAIEADVLFGHDNSFLTSKERGESRPIMSHPPSHWSDLSVETFLDSVSTTVMDNGKDIRILQKHIKLDFKRIGVVQPVLDMIDRRHFGRSSDEEISSDGVESKIIFLNADVLNGPGGHGLRPLDADIFLSTCIEHIQKSMSVLGSNQKYALSLGYRVRYAVGGGFTDAQVAAMRDLTISYELDSHGIGLVLSLNARLFAHRVDAFDSYLEEFPTASILVWTGTHEPGIPVAMANEIIQHFESMAWRHRLGFDCKIENPEGKRAWLPYLLP